MLLMSVNVVFVLIMSCGDDQIKTLCHISSECYFVLGVLWESNDIFDSLLEILQQKLR